ncbi:MAG: hypothetical protein WD397_07950 [Wenzhouxiangellaceae bacterium]
MQAETMNAKLAWRLEVVAGVGHNDQQMSHAAAEYLYGKKL